MRDVGLYVRNCVNNWCLLPYYARQLRAGFYFYTICASNSSDVALSVKLGVFRLSNNG